MISAALAASSLLAPSLPLVEFKVKDKGSFVMEVRTDEAPLIGRHFLSLVDKGFYDKLLFHRKVSGFVIQSGDPGSRGKTKAWAERRPGPQGGTEGLGSGGSNAEVPYEINNLVHDRFTVGMALARPMDNSGDSQFFINLKNNHRLNGMYCVFAKVTKGQEVIHQLDRGDVILSAKRVKTAPRRQVKKS